MPENHKGSVSTAKLLRVIFLAVCDAVIVNIASFLSVFFRYNCSLSDMMQVGMVENFISFIPALSILTLLVYALLGLYNSLWIYAGTREAVQIVLAAIAVSVLFFVTSQAFNREIPRGSYFIFLSLLLLFTLLSRFSYRTLRSFKSRNFMWRRAHSNAVRVMIIGAGYAGSALIQDINNSMGLTDSRPVCVIDDDPEKIGKMIHGVRIYGDRYSIPKAVEKFQVDEIIFAIPSISNEEKAKILSICRDTNCQLKTLPDIYQLLNGEVNMTAVRSVEIDDLLSRESIKVDLDSIIGYISGKVVMVTGGGGSIGSELCRQIAKAAPKLLIILDIYENNAYSIQMELQRNYPEVEMVTLIASVRDSKRMNQIFAKYRPEIVYHAAAHKHVPLMEDSPNEAVKNNVFGTLKTCAAADQYGTKRFVLISSDKAVNPVNVMGCTKRICEMIIQSYDRRSSCDFVAVRFGNVLGSSGSVLPLFKQQIASGGPVTVTHPDIIRYFMTIPEAVSLVLQAGAYAKGGEIFVLDMGKPVKILDLAKNLIRLSGFTPDVDMPIVFTGLRPGEKLYEEMLMEEEGLLETENKLIHIGKPIEFNESVFYEQLDHLYQVMMDDYVDIRALLSEIVSTYMPQYPSASKLVHNTKKTN